MSNSEKKRYTLEDVLGKQIDFKKKEGLIAITIKTEGKKWTSQSALYNVNEVLAFDVLLTSLLPISKYVKEKHPKTTEYDKAEFVAAFLEKFKKKFLQKNG